MQLTAFRREFNIARWGLDASVCVAAAMSLPSLIRILIFPLEIGPVTVTVLLVSAFVITFSYVLSSVLGKWVIRIRSWSFVWTAVAGSALCAIAQVVQALPATIENHSRYAADASLTFYLIRESFLLFTFVVFFLGSFSLIATVGVRFLWFAFHRLFGWKEV